MTDVKQLITEHLDIWLTAETEKKSGRGRSSGASSSVYGVQKLRRLILDLAISGKIVENSSISANQLVDSIIAVRNEKILNQNLKTQASDTIKELETNYINIPSNWAWIRLGNLAKFIDYRGKTPKKIESGVPLITAKNVRFGYIDEEPREFISESDYDEWMTRGFPKQGDLLFTTEAPLGNIAEINLDHKFALAQRVICFQLHEPKISKFIKLLIMSYQFQTKLSDESTGMTATGIKASKLKEIPIPLPPLEEQYRIVAKVDELMQLCDQLEQRQNLSTEAHEHLVELLLNALTNSTDVDEFQQNWQRISANFDLLFTTDYSIEQLKQTILQLAVMGKLVKPEAMDEATKLEIHQHKINFSKKNSEANFVNFHGLNELKNSFSKNMEIFRLGDIADIVRGGSPRPAGDLRFYEGSIPFLKVADITRSKGKFVEGHTSTIKEAGLHKTRFIDSRTVLLTNSGATLGVPAICDFPTTFNDGVAAFINLSNHVFDEYLYLYLSTLTKWFLNVAAQGQGQPNLNTDIVKSTWIALPTRKVQKDIVDMVDTLFSIIDRLQTLQNKLRKTKLHLADSLVANALSDSNDKSESQITDIIIQFEKPFETVKQSSKKVTDQIDLFTDESVDDDLKLLSLAAEITFQLHTEPTFGHLKLQKLIYLCQQLKHMDLAADFKQHAAGPYDPVMARYLDKEFKDRGWFSYDPKRNLKYKPLSKCNDHRSVFNKYFAKETSDIYALIGLFRTSKSDYIEIVATLFACWLRLLEKKLFVTEEQLLKDFYAWSEEKNRFSKAEVLNGYKWMKQNSVIPGY
ncbi:MAG: restriction endonuclease subunit S [Acinetobacter sp.]|uniref:restriction endonuclease subunit S n=1 Tax=Acinetobacter sp. TaxID=472 RepID=UPI00261F4AD9|nr:restriction endonuclease subunit S [Acinetobacter sp.]MDD2945265.1 restriction endonuclease subunit S [Acinetobacter sp.]